MAEREAEAERTRRAEAKKKEEVRLAMLKKQEEIQERAAKEVAAAAEQRLRENDRKEAELQARMLAEKEALQKRSSEKAAATAAKVERSAKLRQRQIEEQRQDFERRNAVMEKRAQERAAAEERRLQEQREKQVAKKVQLQKAKEQMLGHVEAKKKATLDAEQQKELALQRRAREAEEQRRVRQHERWMMVAAQKQRTEESMNQLQVRHTRTAMRCLHPVCALLAGSGISLVSRAPLSLLAPTSMHRVVWRSSTAWSWRGWSAPTCWNAPKKRRSSSSAKCRDLPRFRGTQCRTRSGRFRTTCPTRTSH